MAKRVPYLTTTQVAQMIKMSNGVVSKAVVRGELKSINERDPSKKKFFPKFEPKVVQEWIEVNYPSKAKPKAVRDLIDMMEKRSVPPAAGLFKGSLGITPADKPMGQLSTINQKLDNILAAITRLEELFS